MADALLSAILEQLTSVILKRAEQEVRLVVGVEEQVQKLTSNFRAIQAVLEDAERKEVKEATVKQWLDKLKDVSYDMDDVLDEWNTEILKMQINASMPQRKVCSIIPSSCFCSFIRSCCSCFRQVAQPHVIAIKIKNINERLDVVASEKDRYNFVSQMMAPVVDVSRMTASVVDVSEVHGRVQDKKKIVDMLLSESSQGPTLRIISIVGMGGIGKTTLAQLVYNDDTVMTHFQKRIWVCVSNPFDEIRIAKTILEALTNNAPNLNELDSLMQKICQFIKGQKFLLVLDDVWTEDHTRFEKLKNSLKCGSPGSRILVTTRKETVAKIMGTIDMLTLGLLSDEECWSLISRVAFAGKSKEEPEYLKEIGRAISKKCKGLPLAAKVLGSLLCFKNTREEWESVLDSEVWNLEEAEKGLSPALLLSYYDLSSTLRQCFSYCAVFPKDYMIEKDRLIKLWMAQGYLRETSSKDMEMVGEECFKNLAMRSFFQDFKKDEDDEVITCKMHDIVYYFAQFLTKNECFVMKINSPEESSLDSCQVKARHLMMRLAKRVSIPASIYNVKNLRSLIVESSDLPMIRAAPPIVFDQTCLRTLNLNCFPSSLEELPSEVGKLIHLRSLNLAGNLNLKKLPETVSDLCNLQSLNLNDCFRLKELPRGLGNLINLRHLELSMTFHLDFMPRGIDRLSCLRTLNKYVVSSDGNVSEASTLKDLNKLNHLRGNLIIKGLGNVRNMNEAKQAQLDKKKHLLRLYLDFGKEEGEGWMRNDEEVIDALQPPPNLKVLEICHYRGTRVLHNWMTSLNNLKKLQISWCNNCEFLPPLGKLSSLESFTVGAVTYETTGWFAPGGMDGVKRVGIEFLGMESDDNNNESPSNRDEAETSSSSSVIAFPKLKQLEFYSMTSWEEWDYGITRGRRRGEEQDITSSITIMPCLRSLTIEECPKLKALPDHLFQTTQLEELAIKNCPILQQRYKARTGEDWHSISHIPNILINWEYVQRDDRLIQDSSDETQP